MDNSIILTVNEIEEITGGYWIGKSADIEISGFVISQKDIKKNNMMIATLPQYWGKNIGNSHNNFSKKIQLGVSSFMLEKAFVDSHDMLPDAPVLVVKNTRNALQNIAIASREKSQAVRIQVTGTEGKTGFKYALNYLIEQQAQCYARETSANLTTPILLSLTSLKESTEFTIIEVSCPQPNRCSDRSKIIRPSLAVITNLNISHMNTHGSMQHLIDHKAESLEGLIEAGHCLINEDTALYSEFIDTVNKFKKVNFIKYSAVNENADGFLIEKVFQDLGWNVKAKIANKEYSYRINKVQEHWPLTSVGLLLAISVLGLDVKSSAKDFEGFVASWDSMGSINKHSIGNDKNFIFYDQHFSITEAALKSALNDVSRIEVGGKKVAVISGEHNSDEFSTETHERIAAHIDRSDIDILYTVGEYSELIVNSLKNTSIFKGHFFKVEQLSDILLNTISENDLLFVKGMTKLNFKYLSEEINKKFRVSSE